MRVIQLSSDVLPTPPKYGGAIETYVWNISKFLSHMGVEIHVISVGDSEKTIAINKNLYIHTYRLPYVNVLRIPGAAIYKNAPFLAIKLSEVLSRIERRYGSIDVVHSHYPSTALASLIWRKIFGSKALFVLTAHGEYTGNILDRFIFSNYDVICAVSNYIRQQIIRKFSVDSTKIKVLHNAVDTDLFKFDEIRAKMIREKLGIQNEPLLLYVGRIIPEKGLGKLIKIMPLILSEFPEAKLIIVGPKGDFSGERSQYFSYISHLIKSLKIESSVIYLGSLPIPELVGAYSAADVCVVPSIWNEPFGLVILEAMACSKPVVAFNVGGIPEIISDGIDGFLVARDDEEELASKILFLLEHPEVRIEMGRNARKKVEKEFSYKRLTIRLLEEIYTSSCEKLK
ncbi:MAG: glycosyltransferase family 4 protein [Candidatus Verstraetearchaeota archaeon]|jgi:glycosyltransferase involved in cell wall biosynthesis|nr:glycosyltransferase family 4 protein [Candidatus Verstraetearchaeota archaeon]